MAGQGQIIWVSSYPVRILLGCKLIAAARLGAALVEYAAIAARLGFNLPQLGRDSDVGQLTAAQDSCARQGLLHSAGVSDCRAGAVAQGQLRGEAAQGKDSSKGEERCAGQLCRAGFAKMCGSLENTKCGQSVVQKAAYSRTKQYGGLGIELDSPNGQKGTWIARKGSFSVVPGAQDLLSEHLNILYTHIHVWIHQYMYVSIHTTVHSLDGWPGKELLPCLNLLGRP